MTIPKRIITYVERLGIDAEPVEHRTVFTAYDLAQTLGEALPSIAKTLLLKTNDGFLLAVVPADRHLDVPKAGKAAGRSKASIASEGDMKKHLKIAPGALTPFGGLYDIDVVIDTRLLKPRIIVVGGGVFEGSLRVSPKKLAKAEGATVAAISKAPKKAYKIQPKKSAKPRPKKTTKKSAKRRTTRRR